MMNPDKTVAVKTYTSGIAARTAASHLESEGIEVYIQEDDAGGAHPQLQMARGVRLLVNSADLKKAEKILNEIEEEDAGKVAQQDQRKRSKSITIFLVAFFLLGFASWLFLSSQPRKQSKYTGVAESDQNGDGKPDVFYHYVNDVLVDMEEDRNYDGKLDAWHSYIANILRSSDLDDNFDGKPDAWATCKDQNNFFLKADTNFDGKADATYYYADGLQQRIDWHPNESAIIERRELYNHGVKKEELIDTDMDGKFDLKITYDPFGRVIAKTKMKYSPQQIRLSAER